MSRRRDYILIPIFMIAFIVISIPEKAKAVTSKVEGAMLFPVSSDIPNNGVIVPVGSQAMVGAGIGPLIQIEGADIAGSPYPCTYPCGGWTTRWFINISTPLGSILGSHIISASVNFYPSISGIGTNCFELVAFDELFPQPLFAILSPNQLIESFPFGARVCGSTSLKFVAPLPHGWCLPGVWNAHIFREWVNQINEPPFLQGFTEEIFSGDLFEIPTSPGGVIPIVGLTPSIIPPQIIGGGNPPIPNSPAGVTKVAVLSTDGCNTISNSRINRIYSQIVPGSGGHVHITGAQPGTGRFSNNTLQELSNLTTDATGRFETNYTAGQIGIEEDIIATATFSGAEIQGKSRLEIKIPDLVAIPSNPTLYQLTGETTDHPLNHFVTSDVYFRVASVFGIANMYASSNIISFQDNGLLQINDASLPYGGVFDLCGTLNPNDRCLSYPNGGHLSHRIGVDIDIGREESDGSTVKIRPLDEIARPWKCTRVRERSSIHYRCVQ